MVGGWPLIRYSMQEDLTLGKEAWYYGDNFNFPNTCFRTRNYTRNKEITTVSPKVVI